MDLKQTNQSLSNNLIAEEKKNVSVLALLKPEQYPVTRVPKFLTELPFFYLTQRKRALPKQLIYQGSDNAGRPIRWKVTPNPTIGFPAVEAHEVWVRLVKPAIDNSRKPHGKLPAIIPLGRMRESLRKIGWTEGGWEARRLLKVLNQIRAATCEAEFYLPANKVTPEGESMFKRIYGSFSRMSIYGIGSKHVTDEDLQDGRFEFNFDLEDTLYIHLDPLELIIQENDKMRLFDNQYLFSVRPAERRWYELVAPKLFGSVTHKESYCDVRYSWYIARHGTLKRYYQRKRVVEQMERLISNHRAFEYITKTEYFVIKEPNQEIDYIIRYYPGKGAEASIARIKAALRYKGKKNLNTPQDQAIVTPEGEREMPSPEKQAPIESGLADLLTKFGTLDITEKEAQKIMNTVTDRERLVDQLEWLEYTVNNPLSKIRSRGAFSADFLRNDGRVPPSFETSRQRKTREESERIQRAHEENKIRSKLAYDEHCKKLVDDYIATELKTEQLEELKQKHVSILMKQWPNLAPEAIGNMATRFARKEVATRVILPTFEEFNNPLSATSSGGGESDASPIINLESTDSQSN